MGGPRAGALLGQTMGALLAENSKNNPHTIALIHGSQQISYSDLNRHSDQWAYSLVKQGVTCGIRIVVCFEQAEDRIIATLGALKAGAVVIGLSPQEPVIRMKRILNSSSALLGLVDLKFKDIFEHANIKLLDVAKCQGELGPLPPLGIDDQNLACVLYQSNVAGPPTGVMVTHQELSLPLLRSGLSITSSDRLAMSVDFSRGMDCMETFRAWSCGAGVVSLPDSPLPPRKLAGMLRDHKVTVWWTSGAQLERIAGGFPWVLKSVRGIICHEPISVLQRLNATLPQDVLALVYVPSGEVETGGLWMISPLADVLANVMREEHLCAGTTLHLLDEELEPVPEGMVARFIWRASCWRRGTITIQCRPPALSCLIRWRKIWELACTIPGFKPADTPMERCNTSGRRDGRLVIGGVRVEAGEIELAIQEDARVKHALVAMKEVYPGEMKLTAYAEKKADASALDLDELQIHLRERLPEFMVPAVFTEVEELFLSADGTVDRGKDPNSNRSLLKASSRRSMIWNYSSPESGETSWELPGSADAKHF